MKEEPMSDETEPRAGVFTRACLIFGEERWDVWLPHGCDEEWASKRTFAYLDTRADTLHSLDMFIAEVQAARDRVASGRPEKDDRLVAS